MSKVKNVCKKKVYASKIGPDTPQEAEMIHRGVYDAADIWHPVTFLRRIVEAVEVDFEEFEDKDKHYYLGFLITFYFLKWSGVAIALTFFPEVASLLQ